MENILTLPGIRSRLHYTKEAPNDYHPLNREFNVAGGVCGSVDSATSYKRVLVAGRIIKN